MAMKQIILDDSIFDFIDQISKNMVNNLNNYLFTKLNPTICIKSTSKISNTKKANILEHIAIGTNNKKSTMEKWISATSNPKAFKTILSDYFETHKPGISIQKLTIGQFSIPYQMDINKVISFLEKVYPTLIFEEVTESSSLEEFLALSQLLSLQNKYQEVIEIPNMLSIDQIIFIDDIIKNCENYGIIQFRITWCENHQTYEFKN